MKIADFFKKYPQLNTLRGLVPDKVIVDEVVPKIKEFEHSQAIAHERIRKVKLADIFPHEIEKVSIHLENFLGHWGNVTVEEVCKIAMIAKYMKPKIVFELG